MQINTIVAVKDRPDTNISCDDFLSFLKILQIVKTFKIKPKMTIERLNHVRISRKLKKVSKSAKNSSFESEYDINEANVILSRIINVLFFIFFNFFKDDFLKFYREYL